MYKRIEAEKELIEKYGFKSTGAKHEENYYTWWHMSFYLFEKWGIDKRKAHLSSLIISGQITRDEALAELEKNPVYPKLGIEDKVMRYPKHEYTDYPNDEKLWKFLSKVVRLVRSLSRRTSGI